MDSAGLCTCSWENPLTRYGQAWNVTIDVTIHSVTAVTIACGKCGGRPRPEQDAAMAEPWIRMASQPRPKPFPEDW